MTPFPNTLDGSGALVAAPVVPVYADSRVALQRRRVRSHYGAGGVWLRVERAGRLQALAVRSARGWEVAP